MNFSRVDYLSRFVLMLLAIVLICSVVVCGVHISDDKNFKGIFEDGTIRLGLDLAGGSVVTFQAKTTDTGSDLDTGMNSVLTVMRNRLDNQGLTEALCYLVGDDMLTIEIPDVDDPNEAIANYMQTAVLTFRDEKGNVLLQGEHVQNAYVSNNENGEIVVALELNKDGESKFASATKNAAANGTKLGIYVDDTLISNPSVSSEFKDTGITGGKAVIEGDFDFESASLLASNIKAGALRYELEVVEQRTVGATLGENSLSAAVLAGAIGVALVILFMCLYYKLPGLMASIGLICYVGIFGMVLILTQANLTLAGIAGIVLSIGMAVDVNVVIFERMKQEICLGKSTKMAVKGGFKRAFTAILDSNVTTIIACAVLYFLGSGSIKGFATTLFFGVVISLFTSLVITRALLNLSVGMGITKTSLYKAFGKGANN